MCHDSPVSVWLGLDTIGVAWLEDGCLQECERSYYYAPESKCQTAT